RHQKVALSAPADWRQGRPPDPPPPSRPGGLGSPGCPASPGQLPRAPVSAWEAPGATISLGLRGGYRPRARSALLTTRCSLLYQHGAHGPRPSLGGTTGLHGAGAGPPSWGDPRQHRADRERPGQPQRGDAGEAGQGVGDQRAGLLPGGATEAYTSSKEVT